MNRTAPEAPAHNDLRRMRTFATGLLVTMAVVFVLARTLETQHTGWGYLRAFAEAAMVGALADWFAVVALFRHPLGLPIPHTAIIPNNKDRIGESLGRFITDNFLTPSVLQTKLEQLDLSGLVAGWLTQNSGSIAGQLTSYVPRLLKTLDDAAVRRFLHQQLVGQLETIEVAPLAGKLLGALTEEDRHKPLLVATAKFLDGWVRDNQDVLRAKVKQNLPGFLQLFGDPVAGWFMEKLIGESTALLHELAQNPRHPFYDKFQAALEQQIQALKASPEYRRKGEEFKARLLGHPALNSYVSEVWTTLERWVLADLAKPNSEIKTHLQELLNGVGRTLQQDADLRARLNAALKTGLLTLVEQHRHQAARFIQERVAKWDAEEICSNLEAEVGRDLQFIRINGTIVGGLVGLLLHLASKYFWP